MQTMNVEQNNHTTCSWNRRTKLEKILCFVVVTSLLIFAITVAVLGSNYKKNSNKSNEKDDLICMTPGCVISAAEIIQSLDEKIDPCDNFYKFACGGWIDKRTISDHQVQVTTFSEVQDELNLQLRDMLENPLNESEPKFVRNVQDLYKSCMDIDKIEQSGGQPLQKTLETLGGWPVVLGEKWAGSDFDWMESLLTLRNLGYGFSMLFSMGVGSDFKNNTVNGILLDQPSLGMPSRSLYFNGLEEPAAKAYFKMMVDSAKKLGACDNCRQTIEEELKEALDFETNLAKYSSPPEERRDMNSLYNKFTLLQLRELVPQIDWIKYFRGHLNDSDTVTENETVIVLDPKFLKQFGELIAKTEKRVVANYMMWRIVESSLHMLSKDWKAIIQEYISIVAGNNQETPRWVECIGFSNIGIAFSSYYIKQFFKSDSKQKATEMVEYIRKEFLNVLDQVDWMDGDTKNKAKEKAVAISPYVGYPQELLSDSLVNQIYDTLTVTKENYFENYLNIRKWFVDQTFSMLRKPNVKGDWKNHAKSADVNAFYNPSENSIDIPAGILQRAFFNKDRPNYMNFGGIGFIIGHEITHGFDDMGKQFDKEGNNRNWWLNTTDEHFKEKAQCIIDQYSNYTTEIGLQLNGIMTQGENIADNGGLKQAYMAYHSWVKDHGEEKQLPGLKYTPDQLFWISAANIWCGKYRPEMLKLAISTDVHSPSEFRVIGPMSNLKEFSTAFGCPLKSKMNPEKKCQVW